MKRGDIILTTRLARVGKYKKALWVKSKVLRVTGDYVYLWSGRYYKKDLTLVSRTYPLDRVDERALAMLYDPIADQTGLLLDMGNKDKKLKNAKSIARRVLTFLEEYGSDGKDGLTIDELESIRDALQEVEDIINDID